MKKTAAALLCLALLLQLPVCGFAESAQTEEVSGLAAFTQWLERAYTVTETPLGDGRVVVTLESSDAYAATVKAVKTGDMDGSGSLSTDDVVALLLHISMPDLFQIKVGGDLDKDGQVTTNDAVKLLLHLSMPDLFPLEEEDTEPEEPEDTEQKAHQTIPYTERYLYNTLTEEEKGWYRSVFTAVNDLEEKVALGHNLPDGFYSILFLYMMDNPEHFYLCNRASYYRYGSECGIYFYYSDGTNYCGPGCGDMTQTLRQGIAAKKEKFNEAVDKILAEIPTDIPDVEKEKMAYDRLLLNSYYNLNAQWDDLAEDNWTAYGVMVNGAGVCESYAEAFQTLCLRMGINCTGIVGDAGGGHKWNAVELDGQWYACDITFDDPIGGDPDGTCHSYFNLTTGQMEALGHSTAGSEYPGPECLGTKYSYENYFGE